MTGVNPLARELVLDWHFAFGWWGWVGGRWLDGWTDKAACLLGPTSSPWQYDKAPLPYWKTLP